MCSWVKFIRPQERDLDKVKTRFTSLSDRQVSFLNRPIINPDECMGTEFGHELTSFYLICSMSIGANLSVSLILTKHRGKTRNLSEQALILRTDRPCQCSSFCQIRSRPGLRHQVRAQSGSQLSQPVEGFLVHVNV